MLPITLSALLASMSPSQAPITAASGCPRVDPVVAAGTQGYSGGLRNGLCFVSISPRAEN